MSEPTIPAAGEPDAPGPERPPLLPIFAPRRIVSKHTPSFLQILSLRARSSAASPWSNCPSARSPGSSNSMRASKRSLTFAPIPSHARRSSPVPKRESTGRPDLGHPARPDLILTSARLALRKSAPPGIFPPPSSPVRFAGRTDRSRSHAESGGSQQGCSQSCTSCRDGTSRFTPME